MLLIHSKIISAYRCYRYDAYTADVNNYTVKIGILLNHKRILYGVHGKNLFLISYHKRFAKEEQTDSESRNQFEITKSVCSPLTGTQFDCTGAYLV